MGGREVNGKMEIKTQIRNLFTSCMDIDMCIMMYKRRLATR